MKPITIIGGGLAGLTLGILLRRKNVPVCVIEAGRYPRHRVCGEFLSGRGRDILKELQIDQSLRQTVEARTCSFHGRNRKPIHFTLAKPALCVSRFDLDACLAEEFQNAGGILKTGERADSQTRTPGIIRATGRRRSEKSGARLLGLKAHAFHAKPAADLEMHFGNRQYLGICRLANGRANVCGLFSAEHPVGKIHDEWKKIFTASVWSGVLQRADWDEASFCSVAALMMDRHAPENVFAIGDAAAMIPPLTGNGMSMAFESAKAAFPLTLRYCRGEMDWDACLAAQAADWQNQFSDRLRWAAFVQRLVFHSSGQGILFFAARLVPSFPNFLFSHTR